MQHNLMRRDGIAGTRFNSIEGSLELLVLECLNLAAAIADQMMVMALGPDWFVTGDASTEIDPLHKPLRREQLQDPIDTRDPNTASRPAQQIEDLLGGQAAILPRQNLDHRAPSAPTPKTLRQQRAHRRVDPAALSLRTPHTGNDSESHVGRTRLDQEQGRPESARRSGGPSDCQHGPRVAGGLRRCKRAGRELGDEGCRAGEAVVFPRGDAAGVISQ